MDLQAVDATSSRDPVDRGRGGQGAKKEAHRIFFSEDLQGAMHECLQRRNISRLQSTGMRPLVEAVVSGSLPAVQTLCNIIADMPSSEGILFLPALFVNVDTSRISDPRQLEALISGDGGSPIWKHDSG
ncbi:hypothetical protein FB451DRAFT_1373954 [Mycena latifolia]|nr:hypothetical protein FB451DRAFT_1373954 [Mycena latifolia]